MADKLVNLFLKKRRSLFIYINYEIGFLRSEYSNIRSHKH